MDLFLKKILGYGITICIGYCAVVILVSGAPSWLLHNVRFQRGASGHLYTRLNEIDTVHNVDVLVVGSSHAYRGFDPRIFGSTGVRIFNVGSSSQTPIQSSFLIRKYVEQLKPELLIWEVFPNTFEGDGLESLIDLLSNSRKPMELMSMVLKINQVAGYNTWLVALFHSLLFTDHFSEAIHQNKDTYVSGGYVERSFHINKSKACVERDITLTTQQCTEFENALTMLKERGIKVVLVQAPLTAALRDCLQNKKAIDTYFQGVVAAGMASEYVNAGSLRIIMNDSLDFYDLHHLNQSGVEKFNDALISHFKLKDSLVNL